MKNVHVIETDGGWNRNGKWEVLEENEKGDRADCGVRLHRK